MKFTLAALIFIAGVCALPVHADLITGTSTAATGTTMTTNTTTIGASTVLSPGRYMATIGVSFNHDMAERFVKSVRQVPGIGIVSSNAEDSSIHFAVKNGPPVHVADIQKAVVKADAGAVMSTPILEHSLTPAPGL